VYYYPYPVGYRFHTGFFWGVTSYFSIGWHSHLLHVHYYGHEDFPYFGWNYYAPYYARSYINVNVNVPRGGYVWQPRHRYGDRPNVPIVRGREGRVADSRPEPHYGGGVASSASRYSNRTGGDERPIKTTPNGGGVAGSASRYRPPQQSAAPNAGAPQVNREGVTAGREGAAAGAPANRGTPPVRSGGYRTGGGMSQASKQSGTSERFLSQPPRASAPAPSFTPGNGTAVPRYRAPTAPERQPQTSAPSPQREYRGTSGASRYAAPEVRSAPPRAENFRAAPSRGESRSGGGASYRGGGGGERAAHHGGGGRGGEGRR
jgi:hypothetical protein